MSYPNKPYDIYEYFFHFGCGYLKTVVFKADRSSDLPGGTFTLPIDPIALSETSKIKISGDKIPQFIF